VPEEFVSAGRLRLAFEGKLQTSLPGHLTLAILSRELGPSLTLKGFGRARSLRPAHARLPVLIPFLRNDERCMPLIDIEAIVGRFAENQEDNPGKVLTGLDLMAII